MIVRELLTRLGFTIDEAKLKHYEAKAHRATEAWSTMSGVFGAAIAGMAAMGIGQISKISDEWSNMEARVSLTTKSASEQAAVMDEIYDISQRTRQETTATGDLYTKMVRGTKSFGASTDDVLSATKTVNEALVVGGASTAEAKSTILQLGQALGSGRLQGDELRALGENAPLLMEQIAKAYGVTIGDLKQMGAQGELTSEGIFKAILGSKDVIAKQFEKMPVTIGQAMTTVGNRFGRFLLKINKETGAFTAAARAIVRGSEWIEQKITALSARVGGFGNLMKIALTGVAALFAGPMVAGVKLATIAVLNFFKTALLNPWTWVLLAIILLFDDLYTWIEGGESVIGDWLGSWEDFKASDTFINFMNTLNDLYAIGQEVFPALQELGSAVFTTLGDNIQTMFGIFAHWIVAIIRLFSGDFTGAVEAFANSFSIAFEGVKKFLMDVWEIAKGIINTISSLAGGIIKVKGLPVNAGSAADAGVVTPRVSLSNEVFVAGVPGAQVETQTGVNGNGNYNFEELSRGLGYSTPG